MNIDRYKKDVEELRGNDNLRRFMFLLGNKKCHSSDKNEFTINSLIKLVDKRTENPKYTSEYGINIFCSEITASFDGFLAAIDNSKYLSCENKNKEQENIKLDTNLKNLFKALLGTTMVTSLVRNLVVVEAIPDGIIDCIKSIITKTVNNIKGDKEEKRYALLFMHNSIFISFLSLFGQLLLFDNLNNDIALNFKKIKDLFKFINELGLIEYKLNYEDFII